MHPPDKQISAEDSKAALDQLVALGYIEEPSEDRSEALDQTVRELDYNLAQAFIDGGIYSEAATILDRLYQRWPEEHRFGFKLAMCYQGLARTRELRELVTAIIERRLAEAQEAAEKIKELGLDDEAVQNQEKEALEGMDEGAKRKWIKERRDLVARANPRLYSLRYLEASADFTEKHYDEALAKLAQLTDDFGSRRDVFTLRGQILQRLHRWDEAREAFEEALKIDNEAPGPLIGLARSALAEKDFETAVEHAKASVGLLFHQPRGHYILGIALWRLGRWREAEAALIQCVHQAPLFAAAFRILGEIAKHQHRDRTACAFYQHQIKEARQRLAELREKKLGDAASAREAIQFESNEVRAQPELKADTGVLEGVDDAEIITVVTGLPRSGTSLMMQILQAAGIKAFHDGTRKADASNERGYFEHEKVTSLLTERDREWMKEVPGKAIKVVAPLLRALPRRKGKDQTRHYRAVFMERDMEEILVSQSAMLERLGKPAPRGNVTKGYGQQVRAAKEWIAAQGIPAMTVRYEDLVHQSETVLLEVGQLHLT